MEQPVPTHLLSTPPCSPRPCIFATAILIPVDRTEPFRPIQSGESRSDLAYYTAVREFWPDARRMSNAGHPGRPMFA
jgi:hypothetical protein